MRLIDLSQPMYDDCPNCPGHPPVRSDVIVTHETGGWRLELLTLASHTGSHVDTPLHKLAGGASLDELPLETWIGPAYIADLRDAAEDEPITADRLAAALPDFADDAIALLATGWGHRRAKTETWLKHSPYLAPDGAEWLVDRGARGVGIDHFSVGGGGPINEQTHTKLLAAGVWIVEELHFPDELFALAQPVNFQCLPINLKGHTGAWCRPVVMVNE
jgi:arylformamidase